MMGAGDLQHRMTFAAPAPDHDGYGGARDGFTERFTCWAGLFKPRGDEAVTGARIEGRHVVDVIVRSAKATRAIATDWQMIDARSGDVYNLRTVDAVTDPVWVRMTAERGVAA